MLNVCKEIESLPQSLIFISLQSSVVGLICYEFCLIQFNLKFKYQALTTSDCKDAGIRKFEFVTPTQNF